MSDEEIVLYINSLRLAKLEEYLVKKDSSAEQELLNLLDQLYEQTVPENERKEIDAQIELEFERQEAQRQANRRFAVIHFHKDDDDLLFTSETRDTFYSIAHVYRSAVRDELGKYSLDSIVSNNFGICEFVSDMTYAVLCDAMPYDIRITALVEFDFDEGTVSICDTPDSAWRVYQLKDLSNAIYKADRKNGLSLQTRTEIFNEALAGKEIYPCSGHEEKHGPEMSL